MLLAESSFETISERQVHLIFDFAGDDPSPAWFAVNDGVMGGVSKGAARLTESGMEFSGVLSLENNGGFASVREQVRGSLEGFSGVHLRVRGDGRTYQMRLESDARYWGGAVSFTHAFVTQAGEWIDVFVPFDTLDQSFRGRQLRGHELNLKNIRVLGILLGDETPGPFRMEIAQIGAYK